MSEEEKTGNDCRIEATDAEGDPNLCCCYIIDEHGNYTDPCDKPVATCC